MKLFAVVLLAALSVVAQPTGVPSPYLGPQEPVFIQTLVPGMAYATWQPSFDTYMSRRLAEKESSFEVRVVALGKISVADEIQDFYLQAAQYCALHPKVDECANGTGQNLAKGYADRYSTWITLQPQGMYVQGLPMNVSVAGTALVAPAQQVTVDPAKPMVGNCYSAGPLGTVCGVLGDLKTLVDGAVVTQGGVAYIAHVSVGLFGPQGYFTQK